MSQCRGRRSFPYTSIVVFMAGFILAGTIAFAAQYRSSTITEAVNKYCRRYKVDKRVIYAFIEAETDGDPFAVSSANCIGLMQVSITNARIYYWHLYNEKNYKWAETIANLPEPLLKSHMKLIGANIGAGTYTFRCCLDYCDGNYLKALNRYINGNYNRVSWRYLNEIIDHIINFE